MSDEWSRADTKVQARVAPEVKRDLGKLANKSGRTLGGYIAHILKRYWTNKKRKGQC